MQLVFRPQGARCGAWHHTPWWHCVLHDPYERINVWSHFLPGAAFFFLGLASYLGWMLGAEASWVHNPLGIFCFCAAWTHLGSAVTHVWPDSFTLEKLDHIGIVVLILGTPVTALMAHEHGGIPADMKACFVGMLGAAFLPPAPRVAGFAAGVLAMVAMHFRKIMNANLAMQLVLYAVGGAAFLRNGGHGGKRPVFLSDHHLLHYAVTVACGMHAFYILAAMRVDA
ncbi:hypothetical protein WJX81_000681 [Elliptochloris bilobata]|uniref:Hemolysin III n=1 Tax=Elliptochloris bilobata TaxID=381761 RepID=A0AAW1S804_9CHLO